MNGKAIPPKKNNRWSFQPAGKSDMNHCVGLHSSVLSCFSACCTSVVFSSAYFAEHRCASAVHVRSLLNCSDTRQPLLFAPRSWLLDGTSFLFNIYRARPRAVLTSAQSLPASETTSNLNYYHENRAAQCNQRSFGTPRRPPPRVVLF